MRTESSTKFYWLKLLTPLHSLRTLPISWCKNCCKLFICKCLNVYYVKLHFGRWFKVSSAIQAALLLGLFLLTPLNKDLVWAELSTAPHTSLTGYTLRLPENSAVAIDLRAIAQIESSGQPGALGDFSSRGTRKPLALGLFQLHQGVVDDYNHSHNTSYLHQDALDSTIAHRIASWYLNARIPALLKHFHKRDSLENRLTAYNRGIGAVIHGKEAKGYIKKYKGLELKFANRNGLLGPKEGL